MDRAVLLRCLAQSEAHILEGRRHIERQRRIIATLEHGGHDSTRAERTLKMFEDVQALHIATLNQLVGILRADEASAASRPA